MLAVDSNGDELEDEWGFYVGTTLASNDRTCDDINGTNYDGCYNDLSCNDYSFYIPTDMLPGYYKLIMRFNNDWWIESNLLQVVCNENNCNSTGHGRCNDEGTGCICDEGWTGNSCEHSSCSD